MGSNPTATAPDRENAAMPVGCGRVLVSRPRAEGTPAALGQGGRNAATAHPATCVVAAMRRSRARDMIQMTATTSVGDRVVRARLAADISQDLLEAKTGISQAPSPASSAASGRRR